MVVHRAGLTETESMRNRNPRDGAISRRTVLRAGGTIVPFVLFGSRWSTSYAQSGFDFYIGPNGSDNNPGTQAAPWSITALNSRSSTFAGRSVGLLDGTYDVTDLAASANSDGYAGVFEPNGGQSGSPTVIAAVNPRQAVILAGNGANPDGGPLISTYNSSSRGHIVIDGLVFEGMGGKCLYLGKYAPGLYGSYAGIVVRNCEFRYSDNTHGQDGGNGSTIEIASGQGALIQNNYFHDNTGLQANSSYRFNSVLEWFSENSIYEYNTIQNAPGFYGKDDGGSGATFRYNYVDLRNFQSAAIADYCDSPSSIGSGSPVKIHHNVFIGDNTLISLRSSNNLGDPCAWGTHIYNNTLVLRQGGFTILAYQPSTGVFRCFNNVMYLASTSGGFINTNADMGGLIDYNLYYAASGGGRWSATPAQGSNSPTAYSTLSAWQNAMNSPVATQALNATDPMFVGAGPDPVDYKLQSGSSARNAGRSDGTSGGSPVDLGSWGNSPPTRIGCDFITPRPAPPGGLTAV